MLEACIPAPPREPPIDVMEFPERYLQAPATPRLSTTERYPGRRRFGKNRKIDVAMGAAELGAASGLVRKIGSREREIGLRCRYNPTNGLCYEALLPPLPGEN